MSVAGARVLAIFAHPDDEALLAGGLLAAVAAAGGSSMVLSLTRGEHGPRMLPGIDSAGDLAAVRERELREACGELGVARAECWGYEDGSVAAADAREVADRLAGLLARARAEVLLTFSPEGLYGHADHRAVHRLVLAAAGRATGDDPPRAVYGATWPRGMVSEWAAAMSARGLPTDLWGIPPEGFGADPATIDWTVDVGAFAGAKLRAIARHRSQTGAEHLLGALPADLGRRYLGHEWFVRLTPAGEVDPLARLAGDLGLPIRGSAAVGA